MSINCGSIPRKASPGGYHKGRRAIELSTTDVNLLQLVADGEEYAGIAVMWNVTEQAIKNKIKHILDFLGADNRTHAVAMALRRGIIQ